MKLTLENAKEMMDCYGSLDVSNTKITELPENLTVGGSLDVSHTNIKELPKNLTVGGSLDLSHTNITELPDNLTVGGYLDLSHTSITELPKNLTVWGSLYLSNTKITELPENLTVGGYLDVSNTKITELPKNLTVGGYVYFRGAKLSPEKVKKVKKLRHGDYVSQKYLYADGILTHVKEKKQVGGYTLYVGKIKNRNVVSDGTHYAHCANLREGIADLIFKSAADRGADQYEDLTLDSEVKTDDAITMYRVITGACRQGTQRFIDSLGELKESYSIREIIELTRGQYGAERFAEFFSK